MKTTKLFLIAALIAGLSLLPAGRGRAQTFTTLHGFAGSDGANPVAGLITNSSGNTLYGTTANGGSSGAGRVFAINTDGTGFTSLHDFSSSDGANPSSGLILSGNTLYGTTYNGGSSGGGTVFAINTDGTGFTNLHSFTPMCASICAIDNDCGYCGGVCVSESQFRRYCYRPGSEYGSYPNAGLILSGNTLYGTARYGGALRGGPGGGTVFGLNTDGTGFTNLHSFTSYDGGSPEAGLVLSGNTLYGTAYNGGSSGNGTVFAAKTDATGFRTLHSFTAKITPCLNGSCPPGDWCVGGICVPISGSPCLNGSCPAGYQCVGGICVPNGGGGCPGGCPPGYECVCFAGFPCYCVDRGGGGGGGGGGGVAQGVGPAGETTAQPFISINFDGASPNAGLILSGNTLYGTASAGGSSDQGTVFAVNTDGGGLTVLHNFSGGSDGGGPSAGLILSGNTLYGTAVNGGNLGDGTVFAINSDGTGFTNLHSFTGGSDGANPIGGLILSSNALYGTTKSGGSSGKGTAFSLPLPPLPPVAKCRNVTVAAGANCAADASIDDGSFDPDGDTITVVQSPAAPYPLGDTSVTLTVTNSHGLSNSCVATVRVKGAAEQINSLIALVRSLGLPSGTANSLLVKLQSAASALDTGNFRAACGDLDAFLNEVSAQKGKKLTVAQADMLNAEATRIRAVLGGTQRN